MTSGASWHVAVELGSRKSSDGTGLVRGNQGSYLEGFGDLVQGREALSIASGEELKEKVA